MNITLNTVIETFSEYAVVNKIPLNENRYFESTGFLPAKIEEMDKHVLYVVDLADAGPCFVLGEGYSYLCIDSNRNAQKDTLPDECMLVKGISDICTLARVIQDRFYVLHKWENRLKEIVIESGNYQEIIDASEYILGNPLQVLDASYKLLATTNHILSDDEIDIKLTESGFHSQDTLRKMQESGRLKAYKEETGIIINHPGNPNKYGTVSKWFWDAGMPVVHIIMICKNGAPSPSLIDIFQILTEHCRMCFQKHQSQDPQTGRIYDSLIHDLLFGELTDSAEIDERAKVANIPIKGCFNLYKIVLKENNEWLIKRVFNELFQHLPGARIVIHQFEIIVLNTYEKNAMRSQMKKDEERIISVLENYGAVCGVSAPFERITGMPEAFFQAAKALALGEMLKNNKLMANVEVDSMFYAGDSDNIFDYDDVLVYHILTQVFRSAPETFDNSICWEIVKKMWDEDQKEDNDNCQILYTYLVCERKATRTGEILHMHRNNVIYRLNKIIEMTGMDLEDYWTRMKLLLAFHLLKLVTSFGTD